MNGFCDGEDLYWELKEKIEDKLEEYKKKNSVFKHYPSEYDEIIEVLEDLLK